MAFGKFCQGLQRSARPLQRIILFSVHTCSTRFSWFVCCPLLAGSCLLLLLVIKNIHNQVNQMKSLQLNVESLKKKLLEAKTEYSLLKAEKHAPMEREHAKAQEEIVSLKDLVSALRTKMENLQLESLEKDKVVKTAEANARALQKQSEGFLLEYDRLLEDNENLRSQLACIDRRISHSPSKKYA
ncbi:hypothetical protein KP509_24G037700 [Ceratopteris richardii]|uniref:Endoplasmic reticulum transmembrane protein n=1 Tax=Ceratopteris richardii TaxID=49495 RepID=A0A8T2RWI1_CERRI|nr:hypothetical protein KP509_24G037700 [Ceratopteris richardii]